MTTGFVAISAIVIGLLLGFLIPAHAQQQPYTMYPLKATVEVPFAGTVEVTQCLVITAQGHAVVLDYACPR